MKQTITVLSIWMMVSSFQVSFGQAENILATATKTEIGSYLVETEKVLQARAFRVLLHLDYGETTIKNPYDGFRLHSGQVKQVNLYYSDYPTGMNFNVLNKKRIQQFLKAYGDELSESVAWQLVKQTNCNSKSEAMELFHGFEVIIEYSDIYDLTDIQLDTSFQDFVVDKVLKRNDWNDMLIVSDFTGSMAPYISQLFLWLKLNTIDDRIKQFVFFNDGNNKLDATKVIGKTGGIYHSKSKKYEEVEDVAVQCMLSGSGGDGPENDIEALIKGIKLCPDCKENILIVDNRSSVRDLSLLEQVERPVRVIVCGALYGVQLEYLNIARTTNGSIHLMEQDLFDLVKINEGETLKIGNTHYIIRNNRFEVFKRI